MVGFMAAGPAAPADAAVLQDTGRECAKLGGLAARFNGDPEGYFATARKNWGTEFAWDTKTGRITVTVAEGWRREGALPIIIFVTAFDQFALEAFRLHALDYLTKPIDPERFAESRGRARDLLRRPNRDALDRRIQAMLEMHERPAPRSRRFVPGNPGPVTFRMRRGRGRRTAWPTPSGFPPISRTSIALARPSISPPTARDTSTFQGTRGTGTSPPPKARTSEHSRERRMPSWPHSHRRARSYREWRGLLDLHWWKCSGHGTRHCH